MEGVDEKTRALAWQFQEVTRDLDHEKEVEEDFLNELELGGQNTQRQQHLVEIHSLKQQIAQLQSLVNTQDDQANSVEKTAQDILHHLLNLNSEHYLSHLNNKTPDEKEEAQPQFKLALLNLSSGIKFTDVNIKPLLNTDKKAPKCQYEIQGTSFELFFDLKFTVNEANYSVSQLTIKVSSQAKRDLEKFIELVEKQNLLPIFFKGFSRYARLRLKRIKLFQYLNDEYSDLVSWSEPIDCASFVILENRNTILSFMLVFEIAITETGFVHPKIKLLSRVPQQLSSEGLIGPALTENFLALVQSKGLFKALDIFIKATFLDSF